MHRSALLLLLIAGVAACGSEDPGGDSARAAMMGDPDQSELLRFIQGAAAEPTPEERAAEQTGTDTQIKTEGGTAQECVYKRFTGTALYETLVSFDPNADSIWPGAVVQSKTLPQGLAAPIPLARRPATITLSDANIAGPALTTKYSRTIKEPSLATTREAVASMLNGQQVQLAAKSNYIAESAHSMNEAALKVGLAASWMSGSVKASFAGDWMSKKTTMVVRFIQSYYTISAASPPSPEKIFGPQVTVNDARPYMGPGNAPTYVSSVTYGRMLIMKIESDESESDIRAALDVTFSAYHADVEAKFKDIMSKSSISVFVLGGSPDDAARIQSAGAASRGEALGTYIQAGANFDPKSPGVPISYTIRRLADNQTLKVASTIDYQVPVCTPAGLDLTFDFDRLKIGNDGKVGGSTSGEYEVWMEASDSQGGAAPPTPGEKDQSRRESVVKATASMNDGVTIPIGVRRFTRLTNQRGTSITIGARVKSYENDKQCEMTRTHVYQFNPKTARGEWSNPGANAISCVAKDTAILGNNSLQPTLEYKFTP